ncbi:hypothetical protein P7C70_g9294, partial [Phenoliferia sp. Uapishka_3]
MPQFCSPSAARRSARLGFGSARVKGEEGNTKPETPLAEDVKPKDLEALIKQAGKQTAYMKACWITGQQHRIIFHGECPPGDDDDWVDETPSTDLHDTLEFTRGLKDYIDDLLRTVPKNYPPDDVQKLVRTPLLLSGMTMARTEMRTRVDSALPKLFKLIPVAELENRKSAAVKLLQGDSMMDFAYVDVNARTKSARGLFEATCLVE